MKIRGVLPAASRSDSAHFSTRPCAGELPVLHFLHSFFQALLVVCASLLSITGKIAIRAAGVPGKNDFFSAHSQYMKARNLEINCFFVRGANPFHPGVQSFNPFRNLFLRCKNGNDKVVLDGATPWTADRN